MIITRSVKPTQRTVLATSNVQITRVGTVEQEKRLKTVRVLKS